MRGLLARLRLDPFVAALLLTVIVASFLPARGIFAPIASIVADAAIVFLFFLHGAKLSRQAIVAGITHWRLHLTVLAMTFAVFPVLGLIIAAIPSLDPDLARGMLFLSAAPSTVQSSVAFTAIAGGNVAGAVCAAAISNLAGIVVTPLLVSAMIGAGGGASLSGAAAIKIVLQLLAPFVVGHLLRPWLAGWIDARKSLISLADRGAILLVVYAAFGAAVVEGLWQRTGVGELVMILALTTILLIVVLAISSWGGRMLGFAREDRIVIQFCGSKKSLAAGVPIAGVLFPAATVGAVILPLMVFHQIQMIACAAIARRHALRAGAAQSD